MTLPVEPIDILLVEDSPDDAELTLLALRSERLANSIFVARDGEEALNFLFCRGQFRDRDQSALPRLILLDLKLPKVDGLEVLRAVKQEPCLASVPVVILTSSREDRDLLEGYKMGVNSYIQKPVDFDKFHDVVRQLGLYWLLLNALPPQRTRA